MRACTYAWVSMSEGQQKVEDQLGELREFATAQGWEIVDEYVDHESGGPSDRTQFRRMFADAAQHRFDIVLFRALSGFSREGVYKTHRYLKRLDETGVRFRSLTEPYLDSGGVFRDTVISILGVVAEQEGIPHRERVIAGLRYARQNGTKSGKPVGRPPIIIDGERVVHLRDTEKLSWPEIARRLHSSSGTVRRVYKKAIESSRAPQN